MKCENNSRNEVIAQLERLPLIKRISDECNMQPAKIFLHPCTAHGTAAKAECCSQITLSRMFYESREITFQNVIFLVRLKKISVVSKLIMIIKPALLNEF